MKFHPLITSFASLVSDPVYISAVHGLAIGDLLDIITDYIRNPVPLPNEDIIKVAIIASQMWVNPHINAILGKKELL